MLSRSAGLALLPGLLLASCSQGEEEPGTGNGEGTAKPVEVAEDGSAAKVADHLMDTSDSDPVPPELLGTWIYEGDECEPDVEDHPDPVAIDARITFNADRTYRSEVGGEVSVKDWRGEGMLPASGTYRFEDGDYPRITLDTRLNFNLEGDTLQNWSEGDAVYLCGAIFVRE